MTLKITIPALQFWIWRYPIEYRRSIRLRIIFHCDKRGFELVLRPNIATQIATEIATTSATRKCLSRRVRPSRSWCTTRWNLRLRPMGHIIRALPVSDFLRNYYFFHCINGNSRLPKRSLRLKDVNIRHTSDTHLTSGRKRTYEKWCQKGMVLLTPCPKSLEDDPFLAFFTDKLCFPCGERNIGNIL